MTSGPPVPQRVPTLTEVVQNAPAPELPATMSKPAPAVEADIAPDSLVASALIQEERIVKQVVATLEQRIDLLFEHRMLEALAPALDRLYDGLTVEVRKQLTVALREIVARAVAEELTRHRAS